MTTTETTMPNITDIIAAYRDDDLTLDEAAEQVAELEFVPPTSHHDSVGEFDGGDPELDSFSLLGLAMAQHSLTKDEYERFTAAIDASRRRRKEVEAAARRVFGHLGGQHDQSSHGRRYSSGGSGDSWEVRSGGQSERPSGDGDCFSSAVEVMVQVKETGDGRRHVLAHGVPTGQGAIDGLKFDHAWVERDEGGFVMVVDRSNGNDIEMPAALYYKIGNIDKRAVHRYTYEEMAEKLLDEGTYGPWD